MKGNDEKISVTWEKYGLPCLQFWNLNMTDHKVILDFKFKISIKISWNFGKNQNDFMKTSFLPKLKTSKIIVRISALFIQSDSNYFHIPEDIT